MSKDVFISYKTDNDDVAKAMVKYLENKGISCFYAPRDIEPGKGYAAALTGAIKESKAVVLIASSYINNSEYILNEIDICVANDKQLFPFFIEEFDMNDDCRFYLGRAQRVLAYPNAPESYFGKLCEALAPLIPMKNVKEDAKEEDAVANTTTVFEYIPERGIMINPEDRQRNVSFRADTLVNMFGGIYKSVTELAGEEKAADIFYQTGYASGQGFAQRLNSKWDLEQGNVRSFEDKLKKWCAFDSNVGWGKFDIDVNVDEENGELDGTLTINECFAVDRKKKIKVCEFVRGYCDGVIETLLGVEVKLECITCPLKSKFKSMCQFRITIDE
jgi:predicted hydrocarbon binding protein